jgi:hypothetical protein
MGSKEDILEKLLNYLDLPENERQTLSDAEKIRLNELIGLMEETKDALKLYDSFNLDQSWTKITSKVNQKEDTKIQKLHRPNRQLWIRIIGVASVLFMILFGTLYFRKKDTLQIVDPIANTDSIKPGIQSATLRLANGKTIDLGNAKSGNIASQNGVQIQKDKDGQLIYVINSSANNVNQLNTLSTSVGETYQVRLPDGSLVWLNAASSLTYATNLGIGGSRSVKLEGEAYFEVAKDPKRPFIVKTNEQDVTVLGTHFNISAYKDDSTIKTTLLEGEVKVSQGTVEKILIPGRQVINSAGNLVVRIVDTDKAVAWKNGKFIFEQEDIYTIMEKLSRWYGFEVEYKDDLKGKTFDAVLSREDDIRSILDKISYTQAVHFKIEGRRIIVME